MTVTTKSTSHNMNPLRAALLLFFDSLVGDNIYERKDKHIDDSAVRKAASNFNAVAEQNFDKHASKSDAIYARFISLVDILTITELRKVCEGFRLVRCNNAYYDFNTAAVKHGEGIRALRYGCYHGIFPSALSYRHNPHTFIPAFDTENSPDSGTQPTQVFATVDSATVQRFLTVRLSKKSSGTTSSRQSASTSIFTTSGLETEKANVCVVWIDRAVRGLSVDGDWFVRGLLPYCLVPIAAAHEFGDDMLRPWIWLEWRFSTGTFSSEQISPSIFPQDIIHVALEAMFETAHMMETYEYRDEMEVVIADILAFALSNYLDRKPEQMAWSRHDLVATLSDYKIGLIVAFSLSASPGDTRFGILRLQDTDPFGSGLFRYGIMHLLATAGAALPSKNGFNGFSLIDGSVIATAERDGKIHIMTRLPERSFHLLKAQAGNGRIRRLLFSEVLSLEKRYDCRLQYNRHKFLPADELRVLASCDVEYYREKIRCVSKDDAMVMNEDQTCSMEVITKFNKRKAERNVNRKKSYSMRRWLEKLSKSKEEQHQISQNRQRQEDDEQDMEHAMVLDYNCGILSWISILSNQSFLYRRFQYEIDNLKNCAFLNYNDHFFIPSLTISLLTMAKNKTVESRAQGSPLSALHACSVTPDFKVYKVVSTEQSLREENRTLRTIDGRVYNISYLEYKAPQCVHTSFEASSFPTSTYQVSVIHPLNSPSQSPEHCGLLICMHSNGEKAKHDGIALFDFKDGGAIL